MYNIAYLIRGKVRKEILRDVEKPKTATMISKAIKKHRSSISRILLELEKRGLVKCMNPKDAMHRFYQITEKGKRLLKKAAKEGYF